VLAIYLRLMSPTGSSDLPPGIGRAALHAPVYMVLQLASGTALYIAIQTGELLPHLFTLTPDRGGCSLLPKLCPHEQLPIKKYDALCCPDFPLSALRQPAANRPTAI